MVPIFQILVRVLKLAVWALWTAYIGLRYSSQRAQPNDQPVAHSTSLENESGADEGTSEDLAVISVVPTRSSLGLLDLPAEIRLMIFRSLLVNPQDIDVLQRGSIPRACLNVLRTNMLVHGEAFDVFWRENRFINFPGTMCFGLKKFPRIRDTIQHVQTRIDLYTRQTGAEITRRLGTYMRNPSITRGTLTVDFILDHVDLGCVRGLGYFVRSLAQYTNFRVIEVQAYHLEVLSVAEHIRVMLERFRLVMEPVLGTAEDLSRDGHGLLRFHPLDHGNRMNEAGIGVDRMRLEDVSSAGNFESSGQS